PLARLCETRTRLGDLGEGLPFEGRCLVHRGDEVRDQIVAPQELGLDVGARLLDAFIQLLDPIVSAPREEKGCGGDEQPRAVHPASPRVRVSTKSAMRSAKR